MRTFPERRSPAAYRSYRVAGFAAILFLTAGIGHRFGLVDTVAFFWLLGIVAMLAVAALALAAFALARLWRHGGQGGPAAAWGTVLALCVLAPYAVSGARMATHPKLTDISTDLLEPPALAAAARLRTAPMKPVGPIDRQSALRQAEHYPRVTGRRYEHGKDQVIGAVRAIVAERGWTILDEAGPAPPDGPTTIEVAARSYLLGFPADVAIRVEDDDNATFVDMRSASRYGDHDLGDNAKRVTRFLAELDERMASLAGL